jgi:hypothetical protein
VSRQKGVAAVAVTACFVVAMIEALCAQSGISGRVVDIAGQPLPGVSVLMLPASGGSETGTVTGADGTYHFEKVPDDTYRVDFNLIGFEPIRRNYVVVRNGRTAFADATLRVRAICECVVVTNLPRVIERLGRVLDSAGRPLPRAQIEIVAPILPQPGARDRTPTDWREVVYTDTDGRFSFLAPVENSWRLTASDSGFRPVTQQVSGSTRDPLVITLTPIDRNPRSLPEYERLDQGCGCGGNLLNPRR